MLARISPARLVARILDQPELVAIVQGLEAPVLRRLVEHVGLEDAGEIVSLATTEQLARVFDDDLWRSVQPGEDETFDARRFALWLEVLLGAGEELAVEKVAAMDEDLLILGLSKHVLVIDIDALATTMSESHSDEDDLVEKALESCLYEELEEFRVISKDPATWDPIVTLLVALDKDHHQLLRRILERMCAVTTEYIDDNGGLYDVLTAAQMLESDVAGEREQRRGAEGFVAPSAAASFLRLARVTPLDEIVGSSVPDPITKAHFRDASTAPRTPSSPSPKVEAFLRELRAAGVLPKTSRAVPLLGERARSESTLVQRAMSTLRDQDPQQLEGPLSELAYLVNVLLSACGADSLRPLEAMEVVSDVCSLGLERMLGKQGSNADARLAALVKKEGLVKAFRIGWHLEGDDEWTAAGLRAVSRRARATSGRAKRAGDRPRR
jgi:hypothetical protein